MSGARSRYSWRRDPPFLIIEDRNLPATRSVTNDIEAVIADLYQLGVMVDCFHILYRDTDGMWDQVVVRGRAFSHFQPLRAPSLAHAKRRFPRIDPNPPPRAA